MSTNDFFTVGDLKKSIKDIPDHLPVMIATVSLGSVCFIEVDHIVLREVRCTAGQFYADTENGSGIPVVTIE